MRALRVAVGVARPRVDLHGDELVAQLAPERLEALLEAEGVVGEAQPEQALPGLGPVLDPGQVRIGDADVRLVACPDGERLRRLAEDRGQQHVVDHHGQREPAGEAHADRAHARAAAARVLGRGQRPQPRGDRAVRLSVKQENSREMQAAASERTA